MPSTLDLSPLVDAVHIRGTPIEALPRPDPEPARRRLLRQALQRIAEIDGEGLAMYRALPVGEAFHASPAKYRLAEGSNRSTKTTTAIAELARAVSRCDPYDKYPDKGVALVVGLKADNIAMLWRKFYEAGAFQCIRDEQTGQPRVVRPDPNNPTQLDPRDLARRDKWFDAPPLMPHRLLPPENIAWDAANKGIPRTAKTTTGWRIEWRPSGSRPDHGDHYNLVLNDEEMDKPDWYYEQVRGLTGLHEGTRHGPKFIWSATSQVANPEFAELRERAMAGVEGFERFEFLIENNPYISPRERQEFYEALPEHERETRYYGIPAITPRRIYGTYDPMGIHGCEPFELPPNYCRYVVVDPGTELCATLLAAVDPEERHVWVYEAFELKQADALQWAFEVKERERGVCFEAGIMDSRAGSQRSMNAQVDTAERFAEAAETAGLKFRRQGPMRGFFPGNPDQTARTFALRDWLTLRPDGPFAGTARLQIFRGAIPALDKQIRQAISDLKHPDKRYKTPLHPCDLLDDLEYLAAFDPRYTLPQETTEETVNPVLEDFERFRQSNRRGQAVAVLG